MKLTLSALALALATLTAARADTRFWDFYTPRPSNFIGSDEWWHADAFSGDWWGMRNWLDDDYGLDFSFTYTSNIAGNPVGGLRQGFTYTDNISLGVEMDLEKLVGWQGARLTVSALDRNGTSLSQEYIGNQFTVQQVYGGQRFMFYGLHLAQKFWDDKAEIKVGRFATGDDFASSPLYWLYMNNGIDGNPQALPVNAQFSAYPWAVWAARLRLDPSPEWNLQLGLYQVSDRTFDQAMHGLNWQIKPTDGVMLIGQLGWTPEFFKRPVPRPAAGAAKTTDDDPRGLPGHYWFGAYYSSWQYAQFGNSATVPNAYGLYWHADQMLWQETPGSEQGLTLWSAFVLSPQPNTAKMPFQWNGGALYRGLMPRRDQDTVLFGVAYGNFSGRYGDAGLAYDGDAVSYEMALEWGYRVQLNDFIYIQPDLQYIIRPGGTGSIPDALVLGAQIGVTF